jgi:membrane-bound lytic murein transglycosylase B
VTHRHPIALRNTLSPWIYFAIFLIANYLLSMPSFGQNYSRNTAKKPPATTALGSPYANSEEAMRFADDVAERRNLDREWVRQAIGQARFVPTVQRLMRPMQPSASGVVWKNWRVYRSRFIDPVRIQAGVSFWRNNATVLEKAQEQFGVPAEIIVGIIGVETIYGRDMGNFRVMDALATLAFDFPKTPKRDRSAFFRDELEQFLSLKNRTGIDPLELRGSYAGAMGLGQFMPSSWIKYAIDFDGDGKVDLFNSSADAIGSVANYFKSFGWKTGQPTHYPVSFDTAKLDTDALLAPDILPTFSVESFQAKGAVLSGAALSHIGPLALIELQNGDPALSPANAAQYVAGTENFYVITRYNWSSYYAMSVIELGDLVKAALK